MFTDVSCGFEAVTAPAAGNYLIDQINTLCAAFVEGKVKTNIRCGVHVHVDARDYGWNDIRKLIRVYTYVEPFLYLLAGQHRATMRTKSNGSNYCAPIASRFGDALASPNKDWKNEILRAVFTNVQSPTRSAYNWVKQARPGKKAGARYAGMNLCPWIAGRISMPCSGLKIPRDTTIEFRMHRNTTDPKRLVGWTKLLVRLVDWCKKATDQEVDQLLNGETIDSFIYLYGAGPLHTPLTRLSRSKSAARILSEMAPDCAEWILSRLKAWRKAVRYGRRRVYYKFGTYVLGAPRQAPHKSEPESYEEAA